MVAAVRQLPGVSAAEADHGPGGDVTALRVWISAGSDRRAVEAAVRRVSTAHFGSDPGQERVLVVEAADAAAPELSGTSVEGGPPSAAAHGARPQIVRTVVETAGADFTATVVLSARSRTEIGRATGLVAGGGGRRTVASATIRALEGLLAEDVRLETEHVEIQRAQVHLVLVRLRLLSATGEQPLTGAALVRSDEHDAVVRATLDATNRRVEALLE